MTAKTKKKGDCGCQDKEPAAPPVMVHEPEPGEYFKVRGQEFTLDLLDAIFALQDLAKELPADAGHKGYLEGVVGYVRDQCGVELSLSEADWLSDRLDALYAAAKKKRADALAGMLGSPGSTEG